LNKVSKNVLKTDIFSHQFSFSDEFVNSNCVFGNSNFDTYFLPDYIKFCCVFSCYWKGHLVRFPKMCLIHHFFLQVDFTHITITLISKLVAPNQFFLNNSRTLKVTKKKQETKNVPNQLFNPAP